MHCCLSNVIMRSEQRGGYTVLARPCINIHFEQSQRRQAPDARRYLSSIIYVFSLSLSVSPSPSPPFHPAPLPPHYTSVCTSIHTGSDAHIVCIHRGIAWMHTQLPFLSDRNTYTQQNASCLFVSIWFQPTSSHNSATHSHYSTLSHTNTHRQTHM